MAQLYDGTDFELLVDGVALNCRIQFSMNEFLETTESQISGSWERFRPNNQGLELRASGIDLGAYNHLKSIKSTSTTVTFRLATSDGEIVELGSGWITELGKSQTEGGETNFNMTIVAIGPVENTTQLSFLLLENGDYILLENGDRIKN